MPAVSSFFLTFLLPAPHFLVEGREFFYFFPRALSQIFLEPTCYVDPSPEVIDPSAEVGTHICLEPTCCIDPSPKAIDPFAKVGNHTCLEHTCYVDPSPEVIDPSS